MFKSLDRTDIESIVDILMKHVNERLTDKHITLLLSPEAKAFLVEKGYDSEYGARPLRRTIQRYIEDPLSQLIIEGNLPEGEVLCVLDAEKEQITFHPSTQPVEEPAGTGKDA